MSVTIVCYQEWMYCLKISMTLTALLSLGSAMAGECHVVAHRGASGYVPEHTLKAYAEGVRQGADTIEPDLIISADGVPVVRHESMLQLTTDVGDRAEFADRRRTQTIGGRELTGWFSEDFTVAELTSLRAIERYPELRPDNTVQNGLHAVLDFTQFLQFARSQAIITGRPIGIMPEIKQADYFAERDLDIVAAVVTALETNVVSPSLNPVTLQSFDAATLRRLNERVDVPLVQLLGARDPADIAAETSPQALAAIAEYADIIGVPKYGYVLPEAPETVPDTVRSELVDNAHKAGLKVYVWTFRAENRFLAPAFRSSGDEAEHGDLAGEMNLLLDAGIDGMFTDFPVIGRAVCDSRRFSAR